MGLKVNVKRRIVVNGTEYASVEDMPTELRAAFEQATTSGGTTAGDAGTTRVTVNGQSYDSVEEMPPEVRELYHAAMQYAARGEPTATATASAGPATAQTWADEDETPLPPPIVPGAAPRWPRLAVLAVGLLTLLWLLVQLLGNR